MEKEPEVLPDDVLALLARKLDDTDDDDGRRRRRFVALAIPRSASDAIVQSIRFEFVRLFPDLQAVLRDIDGYIEKCPSKRQLVYEQLHACVVVPAARDPARRGPRAACLVPAPAGTYQCITTTQAIQRLWHHFVDTPCRMTRAPFQQRDGRVEALFQLHSVKQHTSLSHAVIAILMDSVCAANAAKQRPYFSVGGAFAEYSIKVCRTQRIRAAYNMPFGVIIDWLVYDWAPRHALDDNVADDGGHAVVPNSVAFVIYRAGLTKYSPPVCVFGRSHRELCRVVDYITACRTAPGGDYTSIETEYALALVPVLLDFEIAVTNAVCENCDPQKNIYDIAFDKMNEWLRQLNAGHPRFKDVFEATRRFARASAEHACELLFAPALADLPHSSAYSVRDHMKLHAVTHDITFYQLDGYDSSAEM